MPQWSSSTRRDRLPADWPTIRKRILKRDRELCQVRMDNGEKCLDLSNEVDHIRSGDDHSEENLQTICRWHHKRKSSTEGAEALHRQRRKVRGSFRRDESHPGLL